MFIYVIVCNESMKLYVGQHKQNDLGKYLSKKFWDACHHTSGRRSHLYSAMQKHPRESWSIHPIVSGIDSRDELDEAEKYYIKVLKAQNPEIGYNICDGGQGFSGTQSEESRQKISARMKIIMLGNKRGLGHKGNHESKSEEFKKRVSASLIGVKKSPEHAQHIGDGHRGLHYHYTPESKARLAGMKGKTHTEEWKRYQAERMSLFKHSEESKQKMRHPKSESTLIKMREAQRKRREKQKKCKHGHELIEGNLVARSLPHRVCLACARKRIRDHYWRHKGESK